MDVPAIAALSGALDSYLAGFDGCFSRSEGRAHLGRMVAGKLSDLPRKSVEPIADLHGVAPRTLQDFLALHRWDHDRASQILQRKVAAEHADDQAIGIIDETSFAKRGNKTVGVQRQYCGALGKIANCTVSVHIGYNWKESRCQCVLASDLFLPESWINNADNRREAGVPESLGFRKKWQIALDLLKGALANGVRFRWLTFDEGYGGSFEFLRELQGLGQRFVAEIPRDITGWLIEPELMQRGAHLAQAYGDRRLKVKNPQPCRVDHLLSHSPVLREVPWENFYLKDTDRGPLVWRAKAHRFYLQWPTEPGSKVKLPSPEMWLIVAEDPVHGEVKYFISNAAAGVPLEQLLKVAFSRWHIERCFQDQKSELGLDHFECRGYVAVQRHLLITAISHLFLTRIKQGLEGEKKSDHDVPAGEGGKRLAGHL